MTGTSLRDWLAALDDGALAEVLAVRADVCGPDEPGGWDELAARLQRRPSVDRALTRLTRPGVQVLKKVVALGPDATEAKVKALLDGPAAAVDEALAVLERHALVWPGGDGVLHAADPLRQRWPARREAAGRTRFDPVPPALPTGPADPERARRTADLRLGQFVAHVGGMLAECERRPLRVFRTGVQPQALARVARAAGWDEPAARLGLACARHAGLLAGDGPDLTLSPAGDAFRCLPPGEQAARLLVAWWRLPFAPTRTGPDGGERPNALSPKADCDGCVQVRRRLLTIMCEVRAEGRGVRAPQDLADALAWHRPLACDGHPAHRAPLDEAMLLGLVAQGVLSSFGALLAAGDHAALTREASRLSPPFGERATIGADLTVTVHGPPSRRLAKELDAVADSLYGPLWRISDTSLRRAREAGLTAADIEARLLANSMGPLPPSVRGLLARHAHTGGPVPRLQEVPATCVFQSADTELLGRVVRHPALQGLGARLAAPGVLVATGPRDGVLAALRAAGHPAVEDPPPAPLPPLAAAEPAPAFDALAHRLRSAPDVPPRPPARPRPAVPASPRPRKASASAQPARRPATRQTKTKQTKWLRIVTRYALNLGSDEIHLLAGALAEDRRVKITYVDLEGVETVRVIAPPYELIQRRKRRFLNAICEMRSAEAGHPEERHFQFSRIQSAAAADG